jgi:hypothetical protein
VKTYSPEEENEVIRNQGYDGFYFLPLKDDEDGLKLSFFTLKDEHRGAPIDGSSFGDMFHIVMFRPDDDGHPILDDSFEAILGDPAQYIENLVGAKIYGCVLRKTDKSGEWIHDYLTGILGSVIVNKLKSYANSISNLR